MQPTQFINVVSTVPLVTLFQELRSSIQMLFGKRDNLESGHRHRTIPLT